MELNKDDIKHIAYHRFNKSHRRHFLGLIFGGLALLIGLMLGVAPGSLHLTLLIAIPITVPMYAGLFLYNRAADKAAKSFLEECEAAPTLTYVSEVAKDAKKAIS